MKQDEKLLQGNFLYSDWNTQAYSTLQNLDLQPATHTILIKNTGTSVCLLDLDPLQPGESKVISAGYRGILTGRHQISFDNSAVNQAQVTQVFYVPAPESRL